MNDDTFRTWVVTAALFGKSITSFSSPVVVPRVYSHRDRPG